MSTIATVKPEGKYWSARAPHFAGLFNTPESAGEHAILNGATGYVVEEGCQHPSNLRRGNDFKQDGVPTRAWWCAGCGEELSREAVSA